MDLIDMLSEQEIKSFKNKFNALLNMIKDGRFKDDQQLVYIIKEGFNEKEKEIMCEQYALLYYKAQAEKEKILDDVMFR
jgi:hypothetical protein